MRRHGCALGTIVALPIAVVLWIGIFRCGAAVLHAQSGPQTALILGSSVDAASTLYALQNPKAHEANPILAHGGTVGFLAGKVATTAGLTWAIQKMAPKHPKVAKVIGYGGGAVLGGLAARNVVLSGHENRPVR